MRARPIRRAGLKLGFRPQGQRQRAGQAEGPRCGPASSREQGARCCRLGGLVAGQQRLRPLPLRGRAEAPGQRDEGGVDVALRCGEVPLERVPPCRLHPLPLLARHRREPVHEAPQPLRAAVVRVDNCDPAPVDDFIKGQRCRAEHDRHSPVAQGLQQPVRVRALARGSEGEPRAADELVEPISVHAAVEGAAAAHRQRLGVYAGRPALALGKRDDGHRFDCAVAEGGASRVAGAPHHDREREPLAGRAPGPSSRGVACVLLELQSICHASQGHPHAGRVPHLLQPVEPPRE
mmetsp:Transcript_19902/g.76324  ORF Transcript_19902/g.76324 Transcript_19902/m.76324 type:complete len:292 (+) Transcript_19902:2126-3001(+)